MQRVYLRVESADLSAGLVEARAQLVDFRGLAVELCAQRGYGLAQVGVAEVGAVEALLKLVEALAAVLKSLPLRIYLQLFNYFIPFLMKKALFICLAAAMAVTGCELEMIVDKEYWPIPTYGELMFEI